MENTGWVMPTHIIAGAGIVINENDEVLLVKRIMPDGYFREDRLKSEKT